jgi:pre-mRNA-processing factor 40
VYGKTVAGGTTSTANVAASWRELVTQAGKKYYYNEVTKVSVWEMPADYKGNMGVMIAFHISLVDYIEKQKAVTAGERKVQSEEAFHAVLAERGVKSTWTWEEALRVVIDHPNYKCLGTLAERKAAFANFVERQKHVEREERHRAGLEARDRFKAMLAKDPRITVGTRWSEAMEWLRDHPAFAGVPSPRDRVDIFEEFIGDLKRRKRSAADGRVRSPALEKFAALLRSLPVITVDTRWKEAIQIFSGTETFRGDPQMQQLDPIDMLLEFEGLIKGMEQAQQARRQEEMALQRRRHRLARAEMRALIKLLVDGGKFTALTTWPEFLQLVSNSPCFEQMLSTHPGDPTPLDYYWDTLDELQRAYLADRRLILEAVGEEPPRDIRRFTEAVRRDPKCHELHDPHHIEIAFRELSLHPAPAKAVPEEPLTEPAIPVDRKLIERYKHLIKHWPGPPIQITSTYREVRPLLEAHAEFVDLKDEYTRKTYFDKYIAHLRKKAGIPDEPVKEEGAPPPEPAPVRRPSSEEEEGELVEPAAYDYRRAGSNRARGRRH